MPANSVAFDFHGVRVLVRADDETALADMRRDFSFFLSPPDSGGVEISLELKPAAPPSDKRLERASWRWRSARIASRGPLRVIDYEGRALLEYDSKAERGALYCAEPALMHELSYLTILSRVGEHLDRKGLHRVHALGFVFREKGGLLLLNSGGGKSRLSLELIRRELFGLLSDDIPLVTADGKELVAFPLRIGLRGEDWRGIPDSFLRPFARRNFETKRLVDVEYFREKLAPRAPLAWILIGSRDDAGPPLLRACTRAAVAAALASHLIAGIGTPQILELMAPQAPWTAGTARLARIAVSRALCASRAAAGARCARFRLAADPAANAAALERFLAS